MSNPPSPPRRPEEDSPDFASTAQQSQHTTTTITEPAATTTHMPGVATAAPSFGRPFYEPVSYPPLASAPTSTLVSSNIRTGLGSRTQPAVPTTTQTSTLSPSESRSTGSRGGRKSKTHVASACVNCKRAHLSCDVNRPCARCVASGKQDTCFDVQHKKRGRPRLREEGGFKVDQMIPESSMTAVAASGGSESSSRQIATPRHRRTESYRSLRSQGSDGSGIAPSPTYPYAPPPTATQSTFGFQAPLSVPQASGPGVEVPTAYMNTDLVLIRANPSYRQIMTGGQDVVNRRLEEIAVAVDGESFQSIRNRLRAERNSRDPNYLPPINPPGQDPLQAILEADVEQYTQGFEDRTYTWTQKQLGSSTQSFPARVRLAKANTYFVAITLPSFRPVEQIAAHVPPPLFASMSQPASLPGSQSQTPESYRSPARQLATHSAPPPTGYAPFTATQATSAPQPSSAGQQMAARTYPPPTYPLTPYQQQQQPPPLPPPPPLQQVPSSGTPRLTVAEPPTETTAFTPRTIPREALPPQAQPAGPQLPPIMTSPGSGPPMLPAVAGPSSSQTTETTSEQQQQEEASDGEATPRKRRRMGIGDVLD